MHISKIANATAIIALLVASHANAGITSPKQCPDVAKIRSKVMMELASTNPDRLFSSPVTCNGKQECNFNMTGPVYSDDRTSWAFFMDLTADSVSNAKKLVQSAADALVYKSGPTYETNTLYACKYRSLDGVEATAVYY
jgi:hypothetical protein